MRAALESLAARLAAANITEADIKKLRKILDRMIAEACKQNLQGTTRLNNEFHETILIASGNKMLYNLWKSIEFGHWTLVTTRISGQDLEALALRHEVILEALASKDPDRAKHAMQRHLEDLGHPVEDSPPDDD